MRIEPLETRWTAVAASWLNNENNWKWIRCDSSSKMDPVTFRHLTRQPTCNFNLFFEEQYNQPIGMTALSDIDLVTKNANLWYVLGDKNFAGKGYTSHAVSMYLEYVFRELGMESVFACTVKKNRAAIRILERNNFRPIGLRRRCHPIDGVLEDRLLFDLLDSDFRKSVSKRDIKTVRKQTAMLK